MLAYYLTWHLRHASTPVLYADGTPQHSPTRSLRPSARALPTARRKPNAPRPARSRTATRACSPSSRRSPATPSAFPAPRPHSTLANPTPNPSPRARACRHRRSSDVVTTHPPSIPPNPSKRRRSNPHLTGNFGLDGAAPTGDERPWRCATRSSDNRAARRLRRAWPRSAGGSSVSRGQRQGPLPERRPVVRADRARHRLGGAGSLRQYLDHRPRGSRDPPGISPSTRAWLCAPGSPTWPRRLDRRLRSSDEDANDDRDRRRPCGRAAGLRLLLEAKHDLASPARRATWRRRPRFCDRAPAVVLLDLHMRRDLRLSALFELRSASPSTAIVIRTMEHDPAFVAPRRTPSQPPTSQRGVPDRSEPWPAGRYLDPAIGGCALT
jgi:hypothetical protein